MNTLCYETVKDSIINNTATINLGVFFILSLIILDFTLFIKKSINQTIFNEETANKTKNSEYLFLENAYDNLMKENENLLKELKNSSDEQETFKNDFYDLEDTNKDLEEKNTKLTLLYENLMKQYEELKIIRDITEENKNLKLSINTLTLELKNAKKLKKAQLEKIPIDGETTESVSISSTDAVSPSLEDINKEPKKRGRPAKVKE